MSSAKIFFCWLPNQFTNQITLLCDGKDHSKYTMLQNWKSNEANYYSKYSLKYMYNFVFYEVLMSHHVNITSPDH